MLPTAPSSHAIPELPIPFKTPIDVSRWKKEDQVKEFEVYDRFGRLIQKGDLVLLIEKRDIFWKVVEVKPILDPTLIDPRAQAKPVQITLVTSFATVVPGGTPIGDLLQLVNAASMPQDPNTLGRTADPNEAHSNGKGSPLAGSETPPEETPS